MAIGGVGRIRGFFRYDWVLGIMVHAYSVMSAAPPIGYLISFWNGNNLWDRIPFASYSADLR